MRTPEISHAQWRLVAALGVSVLLHVWLMQSHFGKGMARNAGGAPLVVQIQPAADDTKAVLTEQVTLPTVESKMPVPTAVAAVNVSALPQVSMADVRDASVRSASGDAAVLTQSSDPTYYGAGDLDVFPRALVKPDLGAALSANQILSAGNVRATLLIDEAGMVNAVRGIEGPARDVETLARELLLRTRFTSARNKDGRIFKAQVLVALDYDTRAASISR